MAALRTFAALIDQDSAVVLEYQQEKAGFRLVNSRTISQRFASPEAAADAVAAVLRDLKARNASLSVVLQHFGSFFHTLVMPPADEPTTKQIILNEIRRSFNITEPVFAWSEGASIERREAPRGGGQLPRQVFIAGAPQSVVDAMQKRFEKAKVRVEGMTVIPDVFRRLYDALDGSTEATAVLVCLHNGPHVGFFVNGQLELAIEPPLALEGEAPLDTALIIDQLERGAIFLRQQSRGTVATRLLLSAAAADYDALASTIEARTGMRVAELGRGVGSPETIVAMGAVLAARGTERLDFFPRPPAFDVRVKEAFTGPSLVATSIGVTAAAAVIWAGSQMVAMKRTANDIQRLQAQVERGLPAVRGLRESAEGRERITAIRSTLAAAETDRRTLAGLLTGIAASASPGTVVDSLEVVHTDNGMRTRVVVLASGPTGPSAMGAATSFYSHFQRQQKVKELRFESAYLPRADSDATDNLRFVISFVTATEAQR